LTKASRRRQRLLGLGLFATAQFLGGSLCNAAVTKLDVSLDKGQTLIFDEGVKAEVSFTATNNDAHDVTVDSVTAINGKNIKGDVADTAAFLGGPQAFLVEPKQSRDFKLVFNTDPDSEVTENTDRGVTRFDIQVVAEFFGDQTAAGVKCTQPLNYVCTWIPTTLELTVKDAGAQPELSTWAMMALGFASLGAVGYRARRKNIATLA